MTTCMSLGRRSFERVLREVGSLRARVGARAALCSRPASGTPFEPSNLTKASKALLSKVTHQRDHLQDAITIGEVERFMRERAPEADAKILGEPLWLSDFRINCRMVDRMHAGRVFLAGDASSHPQSQWRAGDHDWLAGLGESRMETGQGLSRRAIGAPEHV